MLGPTRLTAWVIVVALVGAWVALYLFPGHTKRLWAWEIRPDMTPLLMGSGYLAGGYYFARVAFTARWDRIATAFPSTATFGTLMGVATIVDWKIFNHDHVVFWLWSSLYFITPIALPILWWKNQKVGRTGVIEGGRVPRPLRLGLGTAGAATLLFALVCFVDPDVILGHWPWKLTHLTTRVVMSFMAAEAVVFLAFFFEDRWSALRAGVESAMVGLAALALAVPRASGDFEDRAAATMFAIGVVALLAFLVVLTVVVTRRPQPQPHAPPG